MRTAYCLLLCLFLLIPPVLAQNDSVRQASGASHQIAPEFRGFWTLNVEKSDFGDRRPKPKTGFVNWGEHGWTFAIVQADGRAYADAVETSQGCTFIGLAPNDLSCSVEVVTPRHIRLTIKQGATIRRIGDIELLDDGTTQTTHHVTPSQGASYVEKTIWEKPAGNDMAAPGVQSPKQTSEEAAVRKLSELQFHQGHDLTCLAGAHETGDSKQGASVSVVKFDPGCIIPWHWHTPNENVMVVDGALLQEWKDHPSSVAKRGDFIHIPSRQVNQVMCVSDAPCVILLYSDGQWDMHFVDASGKEISVDEAVAAAAKKRLK
jgi:quercetin dioxygenase-like cupin family protein